MSKLIYFLKRRLFFYLRRNLAMTPVIWGDPANVSIGRNVELVDTIINCRSGHVIIEDDAFFGHGVILIAGTHDYGQLDPSRQNAVPEGGCDIIIRRGAWIASGAIVIGPCEIGEYAVVGAGAVVTGETEPRALYLGQKARFIRQIGAENTPFNGEPTKKR
jgi:acetyltransferase-like isoleucine patch superfamily enzyme